MERRYDSQCCQVPHSGREATFRLAKLPPTGRIRRAGQKQYTGNTRDASHKKQDINCKVEPTTTVEEAGSHHEEQSATFNHLMFAPAVVRDCCTGRSYLALLVLRICQCLD